MFKNLNELRDWHITQVAKYSRLSEINRSAASDKRNEAIVKKLERCAHNQDELVATHDAAVSILTNPSPESKPDSWYDVEVIDALVRRLDVAINGEKGAARQAMLCDLVAQLEVEELSPSATANEPILGYKHTMFMEGGQTQVRLTESGVNPFGVGGKDYSKEYNVISIPLSLHEDSVGTKIQRITEQDVLKILEAFAHWRDSNEYASYHEFLKYQSARLLAKLNEHRGPDHREIPVNDPIFYFVAQHYPLTAQVVERIYRECIHHCESLEVK